MRKIIPIVFVLVFASGFLPRQVKEFDCNYNILVNPPRETCYVTHVRYDEGWLVHLLRRSK